MPSSDPQPMTPEEPPAVRTSARAITGTLVVLLAASLAMFAVSRAAPGSRDLPRLPALGGAGMGLKTESLTYASAPPTSLADGVVAPAGEAAAYRLNAGATSETVRALTAALGLQAGPDSRSDDDGVLVVDTDSDRVLRVEDAPGHPWALSRGDPECFDRPDSSISSDGTVTCPDSTGTVEPSQVDGSEPSQGSGSSEEARCPPVECPEGQACAQVCPDHDVVFETSGPVDLPAPEDAERRSREVLSAMGLEVARTTLAASADGSAWQVLAEISVGGIAAVGMDTQLSIGEDAVVVSGSGMIPEVDLLGVYPLIAGPEALNRLQATLTTPAVGAPGASGDGREPALGAPEPAIAPEFPQSTEPTSVTGIRLVLMVQGGELDQRGGTFLVPAYLMDASDGSVFTVPAVTSEHLAPTPN